MKKTALFTLLMGITYLSNTQTIPDYSWAIRAGKSNNNLLADQPWGMAADNSGNTYVTGTFGDTCTFGSNTHISYNNSQDVFLAKLNSSGAYQWFAQIGLKGTDDATSVSVDASDNVYVAGISSSNVFGNNDTIRFGNGVQLIIPSFSTKIWIAKYNSSGIAQWAKMLNTAGRGISPISLQVKGSNLFVGGTFIGRIVVGSDSTTSSGWNGSNGKEDIFLARFDTGGNGQWVKKAGTISGRDFANAVAVDGPGNVYITGKAQDTISFGSNTYYKGGSYLAKYDGNGNVLWSAGGFMPPDEGSFFSFYINSWGYALTVDASDNVIFCGYMADTMKFGNITVNIMCYSPSQSQNVFIAKYSSTGTVQWAKGIHSCQSGITGYSIASDNSSNLYITGNLKGVAYFDDTLYSASYNSCDPYVVKYDSNGNPLWVKVVPDCSAGGGYGHAITIDNSGNPVFAGIIGYQAKFGSTELTANPQEQPSDIFVAKLNISSPAPAEAWTVAGKNLPLGLLSEPLINTLYSSGNVMYAGCNTYSGNALEGGGGVYKSNDNGSTWLLASNGIPFTTNIGFPYYPDVFAIYKTGNVLLAGTGARIYRSTDDGNNWTEAAYYTPGSSSHVTTFAQSGPKLFSSFEGYISTSTDSGATWTTPALIHSGVNVYKLAVIGNTIFAGTTSKGIWKSIDNGLSWNSNNAPLAGIISDTTYISILDLNVKGNTLFISSNSVPDGIIRTSDLGLTCTLANTGIPDTIGIYPTIIYSIASNDNEVYAATSGGLYYSMNEGTNWTEMPFDGSCQSAVHLTATEGIYVFRGAEWRHDTTYIITGIENYPASFSESNSELQIYPNPAADILYLQLNGKIKSLTCYNLLGEKMSIPFINNSLKISALAEGIYILTIKTEQGSIINKKFIRH